MTKNENTENVVITDVETKESAWSKIKKGAVKHSGKIKITAAALAGAAAYAILANLKSAESTIETEEPEAFEGSDEETVAIKLEDLN